MKIRNTDVFTVVKIDIVNICVGTAQSCRSTTKLSGLSYCFKLENRNISLKMGAICHSETLVQTHETAAGVTDH
jgi:hypothetical protein